MKLTSDGSGWSRKDAFTDCLDNKLSYDMSSSCCEEFGWYIAKSPQRTIRCPEDQEISIENLPELCVFTGENEDISDRSQFEDGSMMVWTIKSPLGDLYYLHLYNAHNGYYGHTLTYNGTNYYL